MLLATLLAWALASVAPVPPSPAVATTECRSDERPDSTLLPLLTGCGSVAQPQPYVAHPVCMLTGSLPTASTCGLPAPEH